MEKKYRDQLLSINQIGSLKKSVAVERICTFRDDVLEDIGKSVRAPGRNYHAELSQDFLKKATKDQLCLWLETLILAFSATALPLLENTMKDAGNIEEMKKAKTEDQAKIIALQNKLIDAKDEQVKRLQESVAKEVKTVKQEMETFSSVLQKEMKNQTSEVTKNVASSVFSVKKVGEVVKDAVEKEERGKNLVLFGVNEEANEQLNTRVGDILENTGQKPRILECFRLGKVEDGNTRPVKVKLENSVVVREVLRKSKLLKNAEGCRNIFICPDRTVEQRRAQKELLSQLRQKRTENPDARYCIRSGQVMLYTGT